VTALRQLRRLSAEQMLAGTSGFETLKALGSNRTPPGPAMSIIDGCFLTECPEAELAAGHQAGVPS
jgi:hypothetical protein